MDFLTALQLTANISVHDLANPKWLMSSILIVAFILLLVSEGILLLMQRKLGAYLYYVSNCLRIPFAVFSFGFLLEIVTIDEKGLSSWILFLVLFGLEIGRLLMTVGYHIKGYFQD